MIQGTTPLLHYNLTFPTSLIKSAEITLQYTDEMKKVLIVKKLEDCELGETSISARLTQEETLKLPAPAIAMVQLRVVTTDNAVLATEPYKIMVKELLKKDVIE
jgi:hypothetical protein